MPTKKQMFDLWDAEMFWNEEIAKANSAPLNREFTGERIGVVKYDPETGDLKVIVDKQDESAGESKNPPN